MRKGRIYGFLGPNGAEKTTTIRMLLGLARPTYPWTQPFEIMMINSVESFGALNVSIETLFIVILGSFVRFMGTGLRYFMRKEV